MTPQATIIGSFGDSYESTYPQQPRRRPNLGHVSSIQSTHNIQFWESYDTRLPAILEDPLLPNATR